MCFSRCWFNEYASSFCLIEEASGDLRSMWINPKTSWASSPSQPPGRKRLPDFLCSLVIDLNSNMHSKCGIHNAQYLHCRLHAGRCLESDLPEIHIHGHNMIESLCMIHHHSSFLRGVASNDHRHRIENVSEPKLPHLTHLHHEITFPTDQQKYVRDFVNSINVLAQLQRHINPSFPVLSSQSSHNFAALLCLTTCFHLTPLTNIVLDEPLFSLITLLSVVVSLSLIFVLGVLVFVHVAALVFCASDQASHAIVELLSPNKPGMDSFAQRRVPESRVGQLQGGRGGGNSNFPTSLPSSVSDVRTFNHLQT